MRPWPETGYGDAGYSDAALKIDKQCQSRETAKCFWGLACSAFGDSWRLGSTNITYMKQMVSSKKLQGLKNLKKLGNSKQISAFGAPKSGSLCWLPGHFASRLHDCPSKYLLGLARSVFSDRLGLGHGHYTHEANSFKHEANIRTFLPVGKPGTLCTKSG